MADQQSTIRTRVELDVTGAQQEIIKLNAAASDSNQTLEERIELKNKAIAIQNKLTKKAIAQAEAEIKALEGVEGQEKKLERAKVKLNKERVKATKIQVQNEKIIRKLNAALSDSKNATKNLDDATGGIISKFKALLANPIVLFVTAIVGALALLKKGLTSSEEGQNKWNKVLAVASSVVENFIDLASDLANFLIDAFSNPQESIKSFANLIKENIVNRFEGMLELIPQLGKAVKQLFSGDFSGAAETAGDAVVKVTLGVENLSSKLKDAGKALADFTKEAIEDGKKAAEIADQRAEADILERELIVEKAKALTRIEEIRRDTARTDKFNAEERKALLIEGAQIAEDINEKEKEAAELRLKAKIAENLLARTNKDDLKEEAELRAKIITLDQEKFALQGALGGQLSAINEGSKAALEAEEAAKTAALEREKADKEKKKAEDEAEAAEKEAIRIEKEAAAIEAELVANELEIERKRLHGENVEALEATQRQLRTDQILANTEFTEQERLNIIQNAANEETAIANTKDEAIKKSTDGRALAGIAATAEAFGFAKEAAIAEMLIAAPQAIAGSFKQAASTYTPPFSLVMGALGAAGTVVPIIKGLADIKKARFGGKGGKSSASSSGGSISAPPSGGGGTSTSAITNIAANNAAQLGIDPSLGAGASAQAASNTAGGAQNNVVFSENQYGSFLNQVLFKEDKTTI